jgi:hypothetical protein
MHAVEQEELLAQDQETRKAVALTFKFLKGRGIDQNAVAERFGTGHQIVSMVKTGKRSPSIRQVAVLSQLAQEAMQAEPLTDEAFMLAEELTLAWWHAITAQMQAVSVLKQHVSARLTSLQTDAQLTPEDLEQISVYAADVQRFAMGLRHLAELGKTWQSVATRLVKTWERIKAEKYPDGAPRQSQKGPRRRGQGKVPRKSRAYA